ncbi:hypothetical protein HDU91_007195 [Kappamyces sp. JEL0680]|nr:hypothetical protein HDU91_007195 [Kappamyces sp. JEL0680]
MLSDHSLKDSAKDSIKDEAKNSIKDSIKYRNWLLSVNTCIYKNNPDYVDRPLMMKITGISNKGKLRIVGRWLLPAYTIALKNGKKEDFTTAHQLNENEVLFTAEEDQVALQDIVGTFQVVSKESFTTPKPWPRTRRLRMEHLQDRTYYLERSWISKKKRVGPSVSWQEYLENSVAFDDTVAQRRTKKPKHRHLLSDHDDGLQEAALSDTRQRRRGRPPKSTLPKKKAGPTKQNTARKPKISDDATAIDDAKHPERRVSPQQKRPPVRGRPRRDAESEHDDSNDSDFQSGSERSESEDTYDEDDTSSVATQESEEATQTSKPSRRPKAKAPAKRRVVKPASRRNLDR